MEKFIMLQTSKANSLGQAVPLLSNDSNPLTLEVLWTTAVELVADRSKAFSLRYEDSEGDEVTIARNADVKELLNYMTDEKLKLVEVKVVESTTQLSGLTTTMAKGSTCEPQLLPLATIVNRLEAVNNNKLEAVTLVDLLVALLKSTQVADEFKEVLAMRRQLIDFLLDEEVKKVVKELCAWDEFQELVDSLRLAISSKNAEGIETIVMTRFSELLVFIQRLIERCPALTRVLLDVLKQFKTEWIRMHELPTTNDVLELNTDSDKSTLEGKLPEHFGIICNSCRKTPLLGFRYKALDREDFDLCEGCEASGQWIDYEPFIKITDPSRAPKHRGIQKMAKHSSIKCDGCEMKPIVGHRFLSMKVHDFDLCEGCEANGKWGESHGPFKKVLETGIRNRMTSIGRFRGNERHLRHCIN
ncbi:hypothetical protein CCR75_001361 [Bremia lactucae]|uniref:ZZ-type domain-containing protein n=1 Tax=Bremia lactucae TaxID=4779 RepID=A0A976FET3_BRELC|nr:hypothetical protein CCR75_001361 [Bremia lactucae]